MRVRLRLHCGAASFTVARLLSLTPSCPPPVGFDPIGRVFPDLTLGAPALSHRHAAEIDPLLGKGERQHETDEAEESDQTKTGYARRLTDHALRDSDHLETPLLEQCGHVSGFALLIDFDPIRKGVSWINQALPLRCDVIPGRCHRVRATRGPMTGSRIEPGISRFRAWSFRTIPE